MVCNQNQSNQSREEEPMRMNIELKRTLATITFLFATIMSGTHVPAAEAAQVQTKIVPKILYRQPQVGVAYTVKELSDGSKYLKIQRVNPGSPAKRAGLQVGDWISKVENTRVNSQARFDAAVNAAPDRARFRVWDKNSRDWTSINLELRSVGQPQPINGNGNNGQAAPPPPPPPVPGGPDLTGLWRSSLSGTMRFTPTQWGFTGNSIVPFVGSSNMNCMKLNNGSYSFTYTNYSGVRDSGQGTLKFVGWNRIQGSVTSSSGIRANFILTR
jgi:hypothetical protein